VRAKWLVLLSIVPSAGVWDLTLAQAAEVTVARNRQSVSISQVARRNIIEEMPRLFATCSLNSRDHPAIFHSSNLETVWGKVQNEDHIHLRLNQVMDLELPGSRTVRVRELMLGLGEPRFPGPELSRDEQSTVAYVKCSGYELIKFVCAPGIKNVVPEAYHELCRHVDSRE
jgi:hypothetical protein